MDTAETTTIVRRFLALPGEKQRMFWQSLQEDGIDFGLLPIPDGVATGELRAPSYAQRRMWLLWKLDPATSAYHVASTQRLLGALDADALEHAFTSLTQRHETLRTTFVETEDGLAQQVHKRLAPCLGHHDLSALARVLAEERLEALIQAAVQAPFDLAAGPLLRVHLCRLAAEEHVLVLVMHHIVSDAWSLQVLVRDLAQLYIERARGLPSRLPALSVQYADYALWQRCWLEAGEGERQLAYWTAQLGKCDAVLELPTDRPRPAIWSYDGSSIAFTIPKAQVSGLRALTQSHRATLFMVLLAAFKALLYRWSGQDDLRVGVPIANRYRSEIEDLVGFFVNTQVLRTQVDGRQGFTSLLEQVRDAALGAQAHQDLPFERLVEAMRPERSLSHNPLFQVMYNHAEANRLGEAQAVTGLQIEPLPQLHTTTQFDLSLTTAELAGGGVECRLSYARALFTPATIERLRAHFLTLLAGLLADPEQPLDS
ncbi:MAG: condensation domain-containing protein, partial [Geminicoccaceae bacterium]